MGRAARYDKPDTWHHVMNRALARRTAFENRTDIRYFLSRIARAVRDGTIEVHAYCVLTTHFHLLARSPAGRLAGAMHAIQNQYSRYFNRRRKRDGSLWRNRYRSRIVDSLAYRTMLVRYIDGNSVAAGVAADASEYPHGSAFAYARRKGPPWLCRGWVEAEVTSLVGDPDGYDPRNYALRFRPIISESMRKWVARRLAQEGNGRDELDDLLRAAPEHVRKWMQSKAQLADGTGIGSPVLPTDAVASAILGGRRRWPEWHRPSSRCRSDAWLLVEAGLLRELAGLEYEEIGQRQGCHKTTARGRVVAHRKTVVADPTYAQRVAIVATQALRSLDAF